MFMQDLVAISKYAKLFSKNAKSCYNTSSEQTVCSYLFFHDDTNQEGIAKALMIDKGSLAKLLAKLEHQELIQRKINPENRREYTIALTEQGRAEISPVVARSEQWTKQVMVDLSAEEQRSFLLACQKIRERAAQLAAEGVE